MSYIPVIDFQVCSLSEPNCTLSLEDFKTVGNQLFDAFSNIGFVYLKNTGITKKEITNVNKVTANFFGFSYTEKMKYSRNNLLNFGYVGIEDERANPQRPGDYKEAFDISGDACFVDGVEWPDKLVPEFSLVMKNFMKTCKELSLRVLTALSYGMKLKEGHHLTNAHKLLNETGNVTALRSLYYPPIPSDIKIKEGQLRLGEHSDYGTVTLLFQDSVGGLQVQNSEGEFIEAVPIEDTVVVNIGDILQFMTGGELKSTVHRVLMPRNLKESSLVRRSLVYFAHADRDFIVNKPLVYEDGVEKKFKHDPGDPITAYQHVRRKWDSTY